MGPGWSEGSSSPGVVSRPLHMLHDAVGLVNFGRTALKHLIPKTGGQPVCEKANDNPWILHESTPHPTTPQKSVYNPAQVTCPVEGQATIGRVSPRTAAEHTCSAASEPSRPRW